MLVCAVGTAIITSALALGDSLDASVRARAPETLGPIDATLSSYSPTTAEVAEAVLRANPPEAADGFLGAVTSGATIATPADAGRRRVLPSARLVEIDFDEARSFGGDPAATGISGPTPGFGEVVLGRDAAERLGARPGTSVEVFAYGQSRRLRVDRILPRLGVAGYRTPFDDGSLNAFVAPGTIGELSFPGLFVVEGAPPENLLFVSAEGGVFPGAGRSDVLLDGIRERLRTQLPSDYELSPVKADLLRDAEEQGEEFASLFLSLGAFAVLAGAALVVNALVALAGERRRELGILRALGMKRADLAGAFVLEGGLYAVVAAVLGASAGVGLAALAVRLAGGDFSSATRESAEAMRFGLDPSTPLAGFLAGSLVSLVVVAGASAWISRTTVVEAIRDLPARRAPREPGDRAPLAGALGLAAALVLSAFAIASGNGLGSLVFPCLALVCLAVAVLGVLARRSSEGRARRRLVVGATAAAAMLWVILAFGLLGLDGDDATLFVAQGLVLTLAAVVLAVQHAPRLGSLLRGFAGAGGGLGLALRLALAYPFERPFRTGTTLLAYALIVFTLVFSSVLSGVFSEGVEELAHDEGGGYDLLVTTGSAGPVPARELEAARGVEEAATLDWTVAGFRVDGPVPGPVSGSVSGSGAFEDWAISGFGDDFVEGGPPALEDFDRGEYPNEAAVWEAVRADPALAITDVAFLESGGGPPEDNVRVGDEIRVKAPGSDRVVGRRVVAISAAGAAFSGVMVSKESFAAFVENPVGNRHYLRTADGSTPEAVAERLQREFLQSGLEARTFEGVVREALRGQEAFFDLIEGYLAIGLFVGVAGLGVSMVRAVRERRRPFAVLRALGAPASAVRVALLAESGLLALGGVLIGATLALLTSYGLVSGSEVFGDAQTAEDAFAVPWGTLALLIPGVLLTSLLVALPSAARVAKTPPASVLRTAEEGGS